MATSMPKKDYKDAALLLLWSVTKNLIKHRWKSFDKRTSKTLDNKKGGVSLCPDDSNTSQAESSLPCARILFLVTQAI